MDRSDWLDNVIFAKLHLFGGMLVCTTFAILHLSFSIII